MTTDRLTVTKNLLSADLKPRESDVAIAHGQTPSASGNTPIWLHGAYQIDHAYAEELNIQPLHKALIVTWTSDGISATKNLVGDVVLFRDDELVQGDMHVGYFNYDLSDWLNKEGMGSHFVTVSLGVFVSNTLQFTVK